MNCTKCGKEIPDGENKLCDDCKNSLLSDIGNEDDNKFEIKKEQKPKKEKAPKKGKAKIIIAVLAVIIVISLVAVELVTGIFSSMITKTNTIGANIGNNNVNLGWSNIQGNWIYYVSFAEDGMEVEIDKIKTDGSDKQVLAKKDWEIYSINVVGDYLYFIAFEPAGEGEEVDEETAASTAYPKNKIYKMSTDGEELTVINDGEFSGNTVSIYVVKDKIYYVGADYNIYTMDTNGGNRTKISDNQTGFVGVTNKYILYDNLPENPESQTDYVTYIMNLDGTNARPVINGRRLYNPNIVGDVIYYVNAENNAIHRVNVDGTNDEKVYDSKAYNMNVQDQYIYYLNYKDENEDSSDDTVCIHKVKTDGTDHQVVVEIENPRFINLLKDWIYYTDTSDNNYVINLTKIDGSETRSLYKLDFNGQ